MANITLHNYNGEASGNIDKLELVKHGAHTAVYEDPHSHAQIIFKGNGFTFDGDEITAGRLDVLRLTVSDGKDIIDVDHADVNAAVIYNQIFNRDSSAHLIQALTKGDDNFKGSGLTDYIRSGGGDDVIDGRQGADLIIGAQGTDTMTGGSGSDVFAFKHGYGADVITDFDADGGGDLQDYISSPAHVVSITNDHGNTVVDFGGGDTLTLLHVKASHVTMDDFKAFDF